MLTLERIYRYPIKGLSPEPLEAVALAPDEVLPLDRRFALARPGAPFDPESPSWLRKTHFLTLMTDERLAALRARYDDNEGRLVTIGRRAYSRRGPSPTRGPRRGRALLRGVHG